MLRALGATILCAAAQPALAATIDTTAIDISGSTNVSLSGYTNGYSYPVGGSTVSISGVDFKLAGPSNQIAQIVQTSFTGKPADITFAVAPISKIATLYTIINTAYGQQTGVLAGFIEFLFTNGTSYQYQLNSGVNTRDHYGSGATVSNAFGTASYSGSVRFDAQKIDLPTQFQALTLNKIRLFDTDPSNGAGGSPFLAAVSYSSAVAAVPEPATWAMLIVGFGVIGGSLRRRRSTAAAMPRVA